MSAGHRLSSGAMEEVISGHNAVAECAVIGVSCDIKGQQPLGLAVLKSGVDISSGKILRGTMRKIADGVDYIMPATIDDPTILAEIKQALG